MLIMIIKILVILYKTKCKIDKINLKNGKFQKI